MLRFVIRRILIMIPTFFVITLVAFFLSERAPGDPVQNKVQMKDARSGGASQRDIEKLAADFDLDKPSFYFAFTTLADCDTLYKVSNRMHRRNLDHLTHIYGNWGAVSTWYRALQKAADRREVPTMVSGTYNRLMIAWEDKVITRQLDSLESIVAPLGEEFRQDLQTVRDAYRKMKSEPKIWRLYVPSINWHGAHNRYHYWLFGKEGNGGVIRGDFGVSYSDGEEVSAKIWRKLGLSVELILIAIFMGYLVSLPIGVFSARRRGSIGERSVSIGLYALYSLPNFFVGTLLLFLFSNPDYLVWFEGSGFKDPNLSMEEYYASMSYIERLAHSWPYMILPIVTYSYASFAFISRIVKTSLLENMGEDYVRTARAKGLSERLVIWKHALRNSLFPIITMFASIFPMAVGGSVIVEFIFGYPGMGQLTIDAIRGNDYPVLVSIFTLAGFMTILGYLVADILYALVDPRISYNRNR